MFKSASVQPCKPKQQKPPASCKACWMRQKDKQTNFSLLSVVLFFIDFAMPVLLYEEELHSLVKACLILKHVFFLLCSPVCSLMRPKKKQKRKQTLFTHVTWTEGWIHVSLSMTSPPLLLSSYLLFFSTSKPPSLLSAKLKPLSERF